MGACYHFITAMGTIYGFFSAIGAYSFVLTRAPKFLSVALTLHGKINLITSFHDMQV